MQENSTSRLARALSTQRLLTRQAIGLGTLAGVCATARLSPYHEPEPITGVLTLIATLVLAGELAWAWATENDVTFLADELILQGFTGDRHRTPIDLALSHRIASIETSRARQCLANDLRWRLRLAKGAAHLSPGYLRASAYPPLGTVGRRVFREEERLLLEAVHRIEDSPVDPRALVILRRLVTAPPPTERPVGGEAVAGDPADDLRASLRSACSLAVIGTDYPVSPAGSTTGR
jgi:hypothetical protein